MTNFKTKVFRCKQILRMAKGMPCTHCGINNNTTVAAHQNGLQSGRGAGLKGNDFLVAYLCDKCHFDYDNSRGAFGTSQRVRLFYEAMANTMKIWIPRLIEND